MPADCPLPVEVHLEDEARFGLMTTKRRRITARGVKPVGTCQHAYANRWCYSTVAPASGDRFSLLLPQLNTTTIQVFVDAFAAANPTTCNVVLLDTSAVHTTPRIKLPANVARVFLPAYSPELNPVERLWQELRGRMAWKTFVDLEGLEAERGEQLAHDTPRVVQTLTCSPYLQRAIAEVGSWPHMSEIAECLC